MKSLTSDDAAIRQPSLWALGACGESSVPAVVSRVKVPNAAQAERKIQSAIDNLDSPRYPVRERAFRDLESFGISALPHLESALVDGISVEWRMRLDKLISRCKLEDTVMNNSQHLTLRVMRVLEQSERPDAKKLLIELSKANLEAGLSLDAKAAVERMRKRKQ